MVWFLPTTIENEPVLTLINADRAPSRRFRTFFQIRNEEIIGHRIFSFLKKIEENPGKKYLLHSTFAHTYANRWNAVICPKMPKSTSIQPSQESP